MDEQDDLLMTGAAARIAGVSTVTVARWCDVGELPVQLLQTGGRTFRLVRRRDLDAFLRRRVEAKAREVPPEERTPRGRGRQLTEQQLSSSVLTATERRVLRERHAGWTLAEVGKMLGLTGERARQIEMKAVEKLVSRETASGENADVV